MNPARDQRGCSPPLETPFSCARRKQRGILDSRIGFDVAVPKSDANFRWGGDTQLTSIIAKLLYTHLIKRIEDGS